MAKKPGGRIAPDGRPPQAKGVGENAKRHDLERPKTPGLHGSDLQQGDVQALEQGQRIAPAQTQQPAAAPEVARQTRTVSPNGDETSSMQIPDAIDFLGDMTDKGASATIVPTYSDPNIDKWMEFARTLAVGPGASGKLAGAYINQMRNLRRNPPGAEVRLIDLNDVDDAINGMLDDFTGIG